MEKIIKFDNAEIEKYKFHQYKGPFLIYNIDINNTVVSNKVSFGGKDFKYFIGQKDVKKSRPLCIFLPKMSAYKWDFNKTKYTSFLIKDEKLSEKYNEIWKKVSSIIIKEFDSKPVYYEKYLKTKTKSYNGRINTIFKIMKYQKKALNVFVNWKYWLIQFKEKIKTAILRYF